MQSKSVFIFVIVFVTFLISCSTEENILPLCILLDPIANSTYTPDDDLLIIVIGSDTDGSVADIELLLNEQVIATSNASPFEFMFHLDGIAPGTYTLGAIVTDDQGGEASKEIQITVKSALEVFTDSRDGNVYRYVTIGNQIWMADNLAYLPSVNPSTEGSVNTPLYYVLGYEGSDVSAAKSEDNYSLYGVLYNWTAANSCCPDGWHLPTDNEWEDMENSIIEDQGPFKQGFYDWGSYWNDLAVHLKHASGWGSNGLARNTYSFSALPADAVTFTKVADCGICTEDKATEWWTATSGGDLSITRNVWSEFPDIFARHINRPKDYGLSVRCIKDK